MDKINLFTHYSPAMTSNPNKKELVQMLDKTADSEKVINYMASNPMTASNVAKLLFDQNINNVEDDNEDFDFDFDISDMTPQQIIPKEEAGEKMKLIKDERLKHIGQNLAKNDQLTQNYIELMQAIDEVLPFVDDQKIKDYIDKELKECPERKPSIEEMLEEHENNDDWGYEKQTDDVLFEVLSIADAYNTLTGKYSRLIEFANGDIDYLSEQKTETWDFLKTLEKENPNYTKSLIKEIAQNLERGKTQNSISDNFLDMILKDNSWARDFIGFTKTEALKDLCYHNITDKDIKDYLYNDYYLKSLDIPQNIKENCMKINDEYGTKVFLPSVCSNFDAEGATDAIKFEFENWAQAGKGKEFLPVILDMNKIQKQFLGNTVGYSQLSKIVLDDCNYETVKNTLRHELMHINKHLFTNQENVSGLDHVTDLNKFMAKKFQMEQDIMPHKTIVRNGKKISVPDFKNCKYREEFLNAGITPQHISYAYTNSDEFIAVAAEGDFSKYSNEFKEILKFFGMPEWVFELPQDHYKVFENIKKLETAREQNPDAKGFDELARLASEVYFTDDEQDQLSDEFFS